VIFDGILLFDPCAETAPMLTCNIICKAAVAAIF